MNKSISYRFPKSIRLLKRQQFKYVTSRGQRSLGRYVILEKSKNSLQKTRLGITVTRRFGNAVSRNRFKRVVREAFRRCHHTIPEGIDIIIRARKGATKVTPEEIIADITTLSS